MKSNGKNVLEQINNLVSRHYRAVWESSDREEAFQLCNRIRLATNEGARFKAEPYSWSKFDEGYSYRNIFHPDYKVAKDEFVNLVFGWW